MINAKLKNVLTSKVVNSNVKKCLYKTVIRPILSYAFSCWWTTSAHQIERIRVFERRILRNLHPTRGRKRLGHYEFISNQKLYDETQAGRFDRAAYFFALKFLRQASTTDNELLKEIQRRASLPNDEFYKSPLDLLRGANNNIHFDAMDRSTLFNRTNNGTLVYSLAQDSWRPP